MHTFVYLVFAMETLWVSETFAKRYYSKRRGSFLDVCRPNAVDCIVPRAEQWTRSDWETVAQLYDAIHAVAGRPSGPGEFEGFCNNVIHRMNRDMQNSQDGCGRHTELLKAKQMLYEYCFEGSCEHVWRGGVARYCASSPCSC